MQYRREKKVERAKRGDVSTALDREGNTVKATQTFF